MDRTVLPLEHIGAKDVAADPLTHRKRKAPCLASIDVKKGMDHILSMEELNKSEKEIYVMGHVTSISTSATTRKGERSMTQYTYR